MVGSCYNVIMLNNFPSRSITASPRRVLMDWGLLLCFCPNPDCSSGRQSKKCKLDGKTSKMNKVVEYSSEAGPGVDEVEADKGNKCGTVAPEDGGGLQISEPKQTKWKLKLRPALRRILERDHEMVMVKGKRHRLPASPNILQLLDGFVQDASKRRISALDQTLSK